MLYEDSLETSGGEYEGKIPFGCEKLAHFFCSQKHDSQQAENR